MGLGFHLVKPIRITAEALNQSYSRGINLTEICLLLQLLRRLSRLTVVIERYLQQGFYDCYLCSNCKKSML